MKKLLILLSLATLKVYSQGLCPYIGPDLQLPCGITSTTLTADFSNCPPSGPGPLETTSYGLLNIPYTPSPNVGTNIPLTDDSQAGPFPIGFSFCFFGNTYTQVYVGSNGWVSFSAGQSTSWNCATIPIPTANACVPKNCIMGPYFDFTPGGGSVRYQTQGVAPCRKFVVSWVNVASFSCGGANNIQIVLYESTNIIEVHIGNKNACPGWNAGAGTEGLHNLPGTVAYTVPGRNASNWNTVNNSYRWTPSGPPVPVVYNWYQVGNPVAIGTGLTINVTPPAGGADYTCHPQYGACYGGYMTCMGFAGVNGPDTINVIPGPPIIIPTILPPLTFCPGQTITLNTDQLYAQYHWSDGSTNSTYTTNIPGPVSVDVIDVNGCTGTANVVLTMLPNPIINILPANPSICPGATIQMTATGANSYIWSPANSLDNSLLDIVNATPTNTTIYSIIGTDVNGCIDSTYNTVTVLTPPNVTATADDLGVCVTDSTTIHAFGALNYVWTPNASLNTPLSANSTATPLATTIYQVIGTDVNSCVDTAFVTVLLYNSPTSNFLADDLSGCTPLSVNFVNNSVGAVDYVWNIESLGSISSVNASYTFTLPGSYDVQLIAISAEGCVDTTTITDYITAHSLPDAAFTMNPNPADLNNSLVDFYNNSSLNAVNFWWDFGGLGNSSVEDPSFEFLYADTFDITLLVSTINGCVDTVTNQLTVRSLSELWIPNAFTINGDNLNDYWFPQGRGLEDGSATILVEIYNRWGILLYESSSITKPWYGKTQNGQVCKQDVYVYKIYFKNQLGKEFTYYGQINLIR